MMLLLKRHLVALVKSGHKRQTLRLWTRPFFKPNQIAHTPGLGKLLITAVDPIASLGDLTDADAVLDGFASKQALLDELVKIYGPPLPDALPPGRHLYRLSFTYPLPDATPQPAPPADPTIPKKQKPKKSRKQSSAAPPPSPTPTKKKSRPSRRQRPMTPEQRELLKSFILTHTP